LKNRSLPASKEQAPEQPRQRPHRQKEARAAGDPALAIRRHPAAWHDAMLMRVMQQVLAPAALDGTHHATLPMADRISGSHSPGTDETKYLQNKLTGTPFPFPTDPVHFDTYRSIPLFARTWDLHWDPVSLFLFLRIHDHESILAASSNERLIRRSSVCLDGHR
jgi:hypothetical protein